MAKSNSRILCGKRSQNVRKTCAYIRKLRKSFANVVFCSEEILKSFKITRECFPHPGAFLCANCSQTCRKSFVLFANMSQKLRIMRRTCAKRARCSQSLRKSPTRSRKFCEMRENSLRIHCRKIFGDETFPIPVF